MTAHLCMQLARPIINTTAFVHTGQKRARVQSARKTYEALSGAQVTHKFAVDPERMLQLESTIRQISSRKFSHDPETYVLHDQLQNLASVEGSRSHDFNFCNDKYEYCTETLPLVSVILADIRLTQSCRLHKNTVAHLVYTRNSTIE